MTRLTIWTRSFHPDSNFGIGGLGFKGDNRGFSLDTSVTSRIYHYFTVDLVAVTVSAPVCRSDPSESAWLPGGSNDYSEPRKQPRKGMPVKQITPYISGGDQTVSLKFWYAGQNFAFPGANTTPGHWIFSKAVPDLDVTHDFSLRINRTAGTALLSSNIGGDGFPNRESFIIDSSGRVCAIGTHVRIGTAALQLRGGRLLPMIHTVATIDWASGDSFGQSIDVGLSSDFTGNGGPQSVVSGGNYWIANWNGAHVGRDASGPWLRQIEDHVPTGRQSWREVNDGYESIVMEINRFESLPYSDQYGIMKRIFGLP